MLSLSACGGGGGDNSGPNRTAPDAPMPDFTESPDGVFTARDNNDRSLNMAQSGDDLTVIGLDGNDTIRTGSGMDLITGGAGDDQVFAGVGDDIIWSGLGNDTIEAGEGDDFIIFLGTSDADQYTQNAIDNSADQGLDLSDVITLDDINNRQDSDASSGESVDGGAGFDTIVIYGDVDLSDVNISSIEDIFINSSVILTAEQFNDLQSVTGGDQSVVSIAASDMPVTLDLKGKENLEIQELNVPSGTVIQVSSDDDVMSVGSIMTEGELSIAVTDGEGVSLSALNSVVDAGSVSEIMVADGSTLVIDQPLSEPVHIEGDGQIMLSEELLSDPETLAQITVDDDVTLMNASGEMLNPEVVGVNYTPDIDEGDEVLPVLSAENVTVSETAEFAEIIFTLNAAYYEDVTFDYTGPDDETHTVTILAGETEVTFDVTWSDDTIYEDDEILTFTLSNADNAVIDHADFTLTIVDDEAPLPEAIEVVSSLTILAGEVHTYNLNDLFKENEETLAFTVSGPDADLFEVTETGILRLITPATDGQSYNVSVTASNNTGSSTAVSLDFNVDPIVSFFTPEDAATHLPENLLSSFHAYGSKWGGELGQGNGDPTVITWSIATANSQFSEWYHGFNILDRIGTDPTQQEIDAIQASLDMWSAVANVEFVYVDEVANPEIEGNLRFVFMDQFDTGVAWLPDGSADTGDIHINNNLRDQLIAGEVTFGNHILSHEIGHAAFNLVDTVPNAGINGDYLPWEINNHEWTIMSYLQLNNGTFVNAPMLYDVAAAQALFGANPNTGAGDTVYHFTDGDYQTIWDVDGVDDIDFSRAESAVRIDLREAHLSRIGDDGLVAIAYGVTIENAVGSDFDDSIYLNDSINHIQAGLGDDLIKNASIGDWIDGGEGFDTLTVHSLSSDYTLELQEDQTYLLSSADGDITLANIEIISFLDKKINLSDIDEGLAVSSDSTTVYLSVNSDEFDYTLWGVTEDQALAYIGTDTVLAGGEQLSPEAETEGSVVINGVGGVYLDAAYDGSDISTSIDHGPNSQIGTHQLQLSSTSDNEYLIDLNTADEQIAIWDYNGDDRLIIDGMDSFDITDSYQSDGNFVISFRNADDKSVTITINNVRTYGLIEEVVFRREAGDEIYQLLPTESVLEIDTYREDPNGEFLFSNNYLFSGSNTGEGLYLAVDPFSEESYQNLDHIDEFIILGAGNDLIFGSSGSDQIQAYDGDDIIYGGDGGDRILAGLGNDTVYGGDGNDSINADFQSADIEGLSGGDDIIYAGNGDDNIRHGQGDDIVYAGAGDDYVGGTFGGGDDILYGEEGNDYLDGGSGNDTLYGGSGDDEIYGDGISVRPEIAARDGQPGIDTIYAGSGDDTVRGGAAGDIIYGGDGDDYIEGDGPETEEHGLSGHDEIYGGAGNDIIAGNSGNDIISGGAGNDTLNGNEGADIFVFEASWGEDFVQDFTDGEDMLDFSNSGLSYSDLTFSETDNGSTMIADSDGNAIVLNNVSMATLSEADFIF